MSATAHGATPLSTPSGLRPLATTRRPIARARHANPRNCPPHPTQIHRCAVRTRPPTHRRKSQKIFAFPTPEIHAAAAPPRPRGPRHQTPPITEAAPCAPTTTALAPPSSRPAAPEPPPPTNSSTNPHPAAAKRYKTRFPFGTAFDLGRFSKFRTLFASTAVARACWRHGCQIRGGSGASPGSAVADAGLPTRSRSRALSTSRRCCPCFARLHEVGCARDRAGNRSLFFDGYCAPVMLYLLNPLIGSMRSLQHAADAAQRGQEAGGRAVLAGQLLRGPGGRSSRRGCWRSSRSWPARRGRWPETRVGAAQAGVDAGRRHGAGRAGPPGAGGGGTVAAARPRHRRRRPDDDARRQEVGRAAQGWRLHTQLELDAIAPLRIDVTRGTQRRAPTRSHVLRRDPGAPDGATSSTPA